MNDAKPRWSKLCKPHAHLDMELQVEGVPRLMRAEEALENGTSSLFMVLTRNMRTHVHLGGIGALTHLAPVHRHFLAHSRLLLFYRFHQGIVGLVLRQKNYENESLLF